jgi:CPA2 family monovalent cation:H+ antiporter-2
LFLNTKYKNGLMHEVKYLYDILIFLGLSVFIVSFMNKLKLSPVLGYLVVGAVIGSNGYLNDHGEINSISEFGVVFLLFVIGLELTIERLMRMRLHVFGFGSLQMLCTTCILGFLIRKYCGIQLSISLLISAVLAMSSSAIVLPVLTENKRQSTQVGRLSLAVLLMQDLTVVPLLAIMPILKDNPNDMALLFAVGKAGIKAILSIIAITIFGRIFLRPFFSLIGSAKTDGVYFKAALFIVIGASSATAELGLSNAMGAFMAGLLIAETEYRNKIEESILPFQGMMLGLFFMTVGMQIDVSFILDNAKKICIYSGILLTVKFAVIFLIALLFRFPVGSSINAAMLLCQGGEFAFILISMAAGDKMIAGDFAQLLLMVVAVTMAITPMLAMIGNKLESKIDSGKDIDMNLEFKGISDLNGHIIIAGFGRVGRMVAYMLAQEQIDFVAIDSNASLVKKARSQGFPIYHGDLSQEDTLKAVGIFRASSIVLSMSDKTAVRKATRLIYKEYKQYMKNLHIIARVEDYKHAEFIKRCGATMAVPTTIETGLQLGAAVLTDAGVPEHEIISIKDRVRKNDYLLTKEVEI